MKKYIFGKTYKFVVAPVMQELIEGSLELYKTVKESKPDVIISLVYTAKPRKILSVNPKLHQKTMEGMTTSFGSLDVHWAYHQSGLLYIEAVFKKRGIGFLERIRSMEYPTLLEKFEQILHELILIPSCYFFPDISPVHAACVGIRGKAVLLAGTGGVGKSSALLSFRRESGVTFVSDDIAIVGNDQTVYGNMAWPKIYGYNCTGNDMKRLILEKRGLVDRVHFHIRHSVNTARVRRKIRPDRLFSEWKSDGLPLSSVIYLIRESVNKFSVTALETSTAVDMTISVMNAEYQTFHKFLDWECYNSRALGKPATLVMERIANNWKKTLTSAFAGASCLKASIPISMRNEDYQTEIHDYILNQM